MNYILRPEEPPDYPAIRDLLVKAFPSNAEARLVDLLRSSGDLTLSIVAVDVATQLILGHIAFSPIELSQSASGLGLAPVAVLPQFQRQGVGTSLVRSGIEFCKELNCHFLVVLGEPSYYRRFGFEPAGNWGLLDQYGGGTAFQALELQMDSIPRPGGIVRYANSFSMFDDLPSS